MQSFHYHPSSPTVSLGFWCWRPKLPGVLTMLALLSGYGFGRDDEDLVWEGLRGTNDEQDAWLEHNLSFNGARLLVRLAYDAADADIVHVRVRSQRGVRGPYPAD